MREGLRRYLVTILVAFVTASVAAGGTAFAILVNADRVDGYHANQLIRMARSSASANALVGTDGVIRRVKIVAPRSGFLFIVASSDVFGSDTDTNECFIGLDGTELTSSEREIELDAGAVSPVNTEENCNTDVSWPVARGRHTVTFEAKNVGPGTAYDQATLEVLFVPFNGRGTVPHPAVPQ